MGKSSRSKKAAPAQKGGVAVMERPAVLTQAQLEAAKASVPGITDAQVGQALEQMGVSIEAPIKQVKKSQRDKAIATISKVVAKVDADDFDKLSIKLQPNAPAAAESKVVKGKATTAEKLSAPAAGGMIATFYKRTSGAMKDSFGALLQTAEMKGTLKGRWCRHPHSTSGEAITCAKAMAEAKVTVAA